MWNGLFSPNFFKQKSVEAVWTPEPSFENGSEERYDDATQSSDFAEDYDEDHEGVMYVRLNDKVYAFPCTAGEFVEFKKAKFDLGYLNRHFTIQYVGDWGWPWGRTRPAGYIPGIGFFTI